MASILKTFNPPPAKMADPVRETEGPPRRKSWKEDAIAITNTKTTEPKKDVNPCPICYEPIKEQDRVRVLSCNHEFCRNCITEWLKTSNKKEHATCPYCRGKQVNIAHHFDSEGNFLTFFHTAKIWSVQLSNQNTTQFFKNQGKFYSASTSTQLRIMQADGVTTIALGFRWSLTPHTVQETTTKYRDTETDPTAAHSFETLTKVLMERIRLYGTGPRPGNLAGSDYFNYRAPEILPKRQPRGVNFAYFGRLEGFARMDQGQAVEGLIHDKHIIHEAHEGQRKGLLHATATQTVREILTTDRSSMKESVRRTIMERGDIKSQKAKSPSMTTNIRLALGKALLCDFDSSISNVVDGRHLYDDKGVQVGLKVMPVVLKRVRTPQGLGGFLFDS